MKTIEILGETVKEKDIFQALLNEGIATVGIIFLDKEGNVVSRVMDPDIVIEIFKKKPETAIKIVDSIYDSKVHLCKTLDKFIENLCNGCNIPYGRSPAKYKTQTVTIKKE